MSSSLLLSQCYVWMFVQGVRSLSCLGVSDQSMTSLRAKPRVIPLEFRPPDRLSLLVSPPFLILLEFTSPLPSADSCVLYPIGLTEPQYLCESHRTFKDHPR